MTERSGVDWGEPRPIDLPPPAACVTFAPPAHVVSFGRFELRFDPDRMPFTGPRARLTGYVRPLEARPVDAAWLVMAERAERTERLRTAHEVAKAQAAAEAAELAAEVAASNDDDSAGDTATLDEQLVVAINNSPGNAD